MDAEQIAALRPGDKAARWVWAGGAPGARSNDLQELTVVRVNAATVTVDTNTGARLWVPHADLVPHWGEN